MCGADPRSICLHASCSESECGDGFVDAGGGEFCEPPGEDGCSDQCGISCDGAEDCPDDGDECNGGEFCDMDDGECARTASLPDGTECGDLLDMRKICISSVCQESICGDGTIDGGADPAEECEDGNTIEGDGCDNDCTWSCHVETQDDDCDDGKGCTDDTCDADDHTCSNEISGSSRVCRDAAGDCDSEETCDGVYRDCPVDEFKPSTEVCRDAAGGCDSAELRRDRDHSGGQPYLRHCVGRNEMLGRQLQRQSGRRLDN